MASAQELENMRNEATCLICLQFYMDPVSIDCGHNFCRACILQYWGTGQGSVSCPQCRLQIPQRSVRPNRFVSNMVESIRRLSLNPRLEEVGIQCEEHEEKLKLFCETDQRAICVVCAMSSDHKDHTVIPIKEAAELRKVWIYNNPEISYSVGRMSQCASNYTVKQEEEHRHRRKPQAERLRKNINAEFAKRHQLLTEEQRDLITKLRQQEEAILGQIENNTRHISKEITSINQRIAEIQTRLNLQNTEFLKTHRAGIQTSLNEPLKYNINRSPHEHQQVNKFKRFGTSSRRKKRYIKSPASVNLDPKTAHPSLILSKDRIRVRLGFRQQQVPNNLERFSHWPSVLGSEGFTSGRHYWEVGVGNNTYWIVGVAQESVPRKESFTHGPEAGVWALRLLNGLYQALTTPLTTLPLSVSPRVLGVYLDYAGGQVSLYDADHMSHFFTFTHTFTGKLFPYFSTWRDTDLTLIR
uniref:RING-type E3 ubiquitin transferase n=1 Tax=Callorhinchus milii TaxID=7868 RepID=A0A4W3IUD3_CALMI